MENSPLQLIETEWSKKAGIILWVKRDDLLHAIVSGNKFRKLKYNLIEAKKLGFEKILTFGGAYSNHIHATAYACQLEGFKSIGVIRGDELGINSNPTLKDASEWGMELHFVNRETYRKKTETEFLNSLKEKYGNIYIIPEGGANFLAVKGCSEMIQEIDINPNFIFSACGTGTTVAGLIEGSVNKNCQIMAVSALKGGFLKEDIQNMLSSIFSHWTFINDAHFGGYAKTNIQLDQFVTDFEKETGISLELIYTGKMFFAIKKYCENGYFKKGDRIVALHTGGLQGKR